MPLMMKPTGWVRRYDAVECRPFQIEHSNRVSSEFSLTEIIDSVADTCGGKQLPQSVLNRDSKRWQLVLRID